LPVVLAAEKGLNEPRYPSLKGIMAAKKTSELIPLCHPIATTNVQVELRAVDDPPGVREAATPVKTRLVLSVTLMPVRGTLPVLLTVTLK
jgi:molybdenum cofactor biosynthesis enzyme